MMWLITLFGYFFGPGIGGVYSAVKTLMFLALALLLGWYVWDYHHQAVKIGELHTEIATLNEAAVDAKEQITERDKLLDMNRMALLQLDGECKDAAERFLKEQDLWKVIGKSKDPLTDAVNDAIGAKPDPAGKPGVGVRVAPGRRPAASNPGCRGTDTKLAPHVHARAHARHHIRKGKRAPSRIHSRKTRHSASGLRGEVVASAGYLPAPAIIWPHRNGID